MAKDTAITIEMLNASEINEVKIGGRITNLEVRDGQQKKDRDGNLMFNDNDGQPICWNDSYYADFAFQGGTTKFKLTPEIYSSLEVGKRYQFVGRAFMKTPYGEGQPYLSIDPIHFDFLF